MRVTLCGSTAFWELSVSAPLLCFLIICALLSLFCVSCSLRASLLLLWQRLTSTRFSIRLRRNRSSRERAQLCRQGFSLVAAASPITQSSSLVGSGALCVPPFLHKADFNIAKRHTTDLNSQRRRQVDLSACVPRLDLSGMQAGRNTPTVLNGNQFP